MWTTKKELQTALKLSVQAKGEKFMAFVELGAEAALSADGSTAVKKRFCMRTCCGAYQTVFYFADEFLPPTQKITVWYGYFKDAVKALDGRVVELVMENGTLFLWQGNDCTRVPGFALGEEQKAHVPDFSVCEEQAVKRRLNGYELHGLANVLKQIIGLTDKTRGNLPEAMDLLYLENRAKGGFEDLVAACGNNRALGVGRQTVERLGGLGIMLFAANVGRKIVAAAKLLCPDGVQFAADNRTAVFDFGRFELRARMFQGREYINPDIAFPGEVRAAFEFARTQLLAFVKKAKVSDKKINFSYNCGEFKAFAGKSEFQVSGDLESGRRELPADAMFSFTLAAKDLLEVLRGAEAERISLLYAGDAAPVFVAAGPVRYAVVPEKKKEDEK